MKYCVGCGRELHERAEICPTCGVRSVTAGGTAMKSRTTAVLLALFLGGIGAHHFYLGNTGRGVVYLLLVWTFVPAIIALIEGLMYLGMSPAEFSAKYRG